MAATVLITADKLKEKMSGSSEDHETLSRALELTLAIYEDEKLADDLTRDAASSGTDM